MMPKLSRRQMLMGAVGAMGAFGATGAAGILSPLDARQSDEFQLTSRMTSYSFGDQVTEGLVSLVDNAPPPVLRLRQGRKAVLNYTNGLEDYSTLHWHGIRLPNAMDGVPYLTQFPVGQGETFRYEFIPPDAGTYWYHPHCRTMDQMALGLTGILIVDENDDPGFDADIPLNLKDFRLNADSTVLPYFSARGAARGGTFGNVKTTNWQSDPVQDVPAGGLIRLRFVATDTTRVFKMVFPDVPGQIIAWDGHPVEQDVPWPTQDNPLLLGPGQRVDVVVVAPEEEGSELAFVNLIGRNPAYNLVRLRSVGQSLGRVAEDIRPLPRNPVEPADLGNPQVHEIVFGWTPEGGDVDNGLCGTYGYTFWSINRSPWPGDAVQGVGPVATLKQGQSYILRMRNESPYMHPIHLHGLVFKPLRSNLRNVPANYTDTYLLLKDEIVDVVVRADNPGHWAFHCHVIEHQKTGLSGYISVV